MDVWRYTESPDGSPDTTWSVRSRVLRKNQLSAGSRGCREEGHEDVDDEDGIIEFRLSDFHPSLPDGVCVPVSHRTLLDIVDTAAATQRLHDETLEASYTKLPEKKKALAEKKKALAEKQKTLTSQSLYVSRMRARPWRL